MKKLNWIFAGIIVALLTSFAFMSEIAGGIQGKVKPVEGLNAVIAISGTDTLQASTSEGVFVFTNLKKGTYMLWIRANAPYKDTTIQNVAVADSATTDVGEIMLQK